MSTFFKRLVAVCVSLFLLTYVGYQAYSAFHVSVSTQRAQLRTVEDQIAATGFVLRNETLITTKAGGIVDYLVSDGERVEKGGAVASVYPTAEQAEIEREIRQLDNRIKQLQITAVAGNTMAVDINVLDADIGDKFSQIASLAGDTNVNGLSDAETEFLNLLNEKQIVTGKVTGFTKELAQLQEQRKSLVARRSNSISTITSPISGYFVSQVDGYEGSFNLSKLSAITAAQVDALLAAKPSAVSAAGKVISSYEWYIVCSPSPDDAQRLHSGVSVGVSFPFTTGGDLPATVTALNRDASNRYAAVLTCDFMTSDLAGTRSGDIRITLGSYTGVRVENSELCVENGVRGVYILDGDIVRFRTLQVLYSGDDFVISKNDPSDGKLLQANDLIIVGGNKLYDGKIVR
ncbi:MAG: HlyD family efflux transporter periplasmic adaptor subunit [Clostridia bacterium]|nr:HlyD family efflux transporter periplasmic adaptor subunit [Clostridia bacterium]